MQEIVMGVRGMSCQGCVNSVTAVLSGLPGVERVQVALELAQARVLYDPGRIDPDDFRQAIEEAGFDAS